MRFIHTAALLLVALILAPHATAQEYLIGRGKADVTGPVVGVQLWGFVRDGQISEGLHIRLHARAYVIAEPNGDRVAFVSADIGSITNFMQLDIIDRVRAEVGEGYSIDNVLISATHTHAAPGGYWHYGATSPLGSAFHRQHYEAIVGGITDAIVQAHNDLAPGTITIARGELDEGGANRSMTAYLNNPESERALYDSDTDKDMTLIKFTRGSEDIGSINWFAIHPTAMTYDNKLISGDHKGAASLLFEAAEGPDFVAAFAQSNCGDVTPNTNLNNTGPGDGEFDTTRIFAERQYAKARELFDNASESLNGAIVSRQMYVEMPGLAINDAYTGAGIQHTCPSAYGYAFAAGSTEDGGGHPMFKEGMKTQNKMIDNIAKDQLGVEPPSDECRECHGEKAILITTGEMKPEPGYTQVIPLTLTKIGQLVLISVPSEVTTMAGRRLRATVESVLGGDNYYVIAGYTNDYTGYVTTKEEYDTQQYEGGHTLYGPWTLAAYQQEFTRLANAVKEAGSVDRGPQPVELRGREQNTPLGSGPETSGGKSFGELVSKAKRSYPPGKQAEATFVSGNPSNDYRTDIHYIEIQKQVGDSWETYNTDDGWATKCRWANPGEDSNEWHMTATWDIPEDTEEGVYRFLHRGNYTENETVQRFETTSNEFKVK